MARDQIVALLKEEIARLQSALALIDNHVPRPGSIPDLIAPATKKRRGWTKAQRKAHSEKQKAAWEKRRAKASKGKAASK